MGTEAARALSGLADRFGLPETAAAALAILLEALAEPGAPTSVHDPAEAVDVHLADSMVALDLPLFSSPSSISVIADIGSGAGLPGLALAAALPSARVVLVESVARKAAWAQDVAQRCGLANVEAVAARAEAWPEGLGACDVVTARALASLPVLAEYAAPLLRAGGTLVAWKGAVDAREERDGRHAAATLGLSDPEIHPVTPFRGSERRTLWTFSKTAPTPAGYPRREGMAAKRPLSAPTS